MSSYPSTPRADLLAWCQEHSTAFTNNAAAIGLTPEQAIAFASATSTAVDAVADQTTAKDAALVATQGAQTATANLRSIAGDTLRIIRAFAEVQANPDTVYGLAQIPLPSPPTPIAPPAKPESIAGVLDTATGALTLRWKASNPANAGGTSYLITRKLTGESDFTFIGSTGAKNFTDANLPSGVEQAQYMVQGQRSDLKGPVSEVFTVSFGRAATGETTMTAQQAPKLAA